MKEIMKALIFPWKVDLINIDIPKPKANENLAEIHSVGICVSDIGIFEGGHWIEARNPGGHGHETGALVIVESKR